MFDGSMEDKFVQDVDRNLYVNVILDLVLRKGADRRIIFSCFDPDICTMLRFKQNRYPVMFLTQSLCEINKYMDPRGRNFEYSVYNATAMELLGIVSSSQDLLCDNSKVFKLNIKTIF